MNVDLDEEQLWRFRSSADEPADFDSFWAQTLGQVDRLPLSVTLRPHELQLDGIEIFDVRFAGFDGHPIAAWLYMPRRRDAPLPGVVEYVGYEGGRGHALQGFFWAAAGYAHLVMDARGQGSGWSAGDTGDPAGIPGPAAGGFLTRGIESRETYYYRRLYVDAVRAVDAMASLPAVDAARLAVIGQSQGGSLALVAGAFRDNLRAVVSLQPGFCDYRRSVDITDSEPIAEIVRYLAIHRGRADRVFETLSYFDCVNIAKRITASTWMAAGLMDQVCPPSTIFGAFHNLAGPKSMRLWPYNAHEGGEFDDIAIALAVFRRTLT